MAKRARRTGKPRNTFDIAARRGILPLRRKVDPESYPLLCEAQGMLRPEFNGIGRWYTVNDVAVTLIGMTRLNNGVLLSAPKSQKVIDQIPSCSEPMAVQIGNIALFGIGKLGVNILDIDTDDSSPKIYPEVAALEAAYRQYGFKLSPYVREEDGSEGVYRSHLTLANLYQQGEAILQDERARDRYDRIAGLAGEHILLQPVDIPVIGKRR